jgi:uncharacterized protein GlcG (DUF336 family)
MSITLDDALKIAQAAFTKGAERGVTKISVVITDPGGHIRLAMRADTQGIFGVATATGKAVTALGFNRPTLAITKAFSDQATAAISGATDGKFVPLGGGVVITDQAGAIIGGAGLSGGLPEVDDAIITEAVRAHGYLTLA